MKDTLYMTKIINLFGGPGTGKSTGAAHIFSQLKMHTNIKVEFVYEYAKKLTYAKRQHHLKEQDYVYTKQRHDIEALIGQVDYILVDSPLLLSLAYIPNDFPQSFRLFVLEMWNRYQNINFFLKRVKPYQLYGRNQKEEEAIALDNKIYGILNTYGNGYVIVNGCEEGYNQILKFIIEDHGVFSNR